ncbi:hypothetical protein CTA2_10377 [Colletotrichum tanaceti]|nr:hypothetical protein CTA2_10377 [Colletotrichum tanaceti]
MHLLITTTIFGILLLLGGFAQSAATDVSPLPPAKFIEGSSIHDLARQGWKIFLDGKFGEGSSSSRLQKAKPSGSTFGAARKPKIGFEIETVDILFYNGHCTLHQNQEMKGHRVIRHQGLAENGNGWFLGVDAKSNKKMILTPEYDLLLDLDNIRELGSITEAVMRDISRFDTAPYFRMEDRRGRESPCNPWKKLIFSSRSSKASWDVQATAPLMLEAVHDLLIAAFHREKTSTSNKDKTWMKNTVYVEKTWLKSEYFRTQTRGSDWATKDVLGFLSIMLTNIKNAQKLSAPFWRYYRRTALRTQGPKTLVWLMPRNSWKSVFSLVENKLPDQGETLWDILEHLACYQNTPNRELRLDTRFCAGTINNPKPNGKLEEKAWVKKGYPSLSVKDWVNSIINPDETQDLLSKFDAEYYYGQIGAFDGLGKGFEHVLGSNRPVSLWEFRGLGMSRTRELPDRLQDIRNAVVEFHEKYPEAPPASRTIKQG